METDTHSSQRWYNESVKTVTAPHSNSGAVMKKNLNINRRYISSRIVDVIEHELSGNIDQKLYRLGKPSEAIQAAENALKDVVVPEKFSSSFRLTCRKFSNETVQFSSPGASFRPQTQQDLFEHRRATEKSGSYKISAPYQDTLLRQKSPNSVSAFMRFETMSVQNMAQGTPVSKDSQSPYHLNGKFSECMSKSRIKRFSSIENVPIAEMVSPHQWRNRVQSSGTNAKDARQSTSLTLLTQQKPSRLVHSP